MGNGFRCGKTAGDDVLLPECFHNGSLDIFFVAVLAGVAVIDMLLHDDLSRNDPELVDHLGADLVHGITTLRAHQILAIQAVLNPFSGQILRRNGVQSLFVLLVPLVSRYNGDILRFFLFCCGEHLCLLEQEAQLFHEGFFTLFGRCTKLFVTSKTQRFHENIRTAFKLRDFLSLNLKFLVFRAGNGDHFCVAYLVIICLLHINIIAYCL